MHAYYAIFMPQLTKFVRVNTIGYKYKKIFKKVLYMYLSITVT